MVETVLLLDGDLIVYRNAAACEKEAKFDEDNWVLWLNEEEAWDAIRYSIEGFKRRLDGDRLILCFSEGRSFRYGLCPTYKSNRAGQRKPLGYNALLDRVKMTWETKSFDGLEADDVMGLLQTKPGVKERRIIVSDDKDMKTIPGLLYRQGKLLTIDEQEADYWHLYQALIGDTADGFPGCPGCGPKTAEKILSSEGPLWPVVVGAFESKKLTEDDALLQARLARIIRWSDWNTKTREVILWTP